MVLSLCPRPVSRFNDDLWIIFGIECCAVDVDSTMRTFVLCSLGHQMLLGASISFSLIESGLAKKASTQTSVRRSPLAASDFLL